MNCFQFCFPILNFSEILTIHSIRHIMYLVILDNFAATTLAKYIPAITAFVEACHSLHLSLDSLTAVQMADGLIAVRLGPIIRSLYMNSATIIKALRWSVKQLGADCFQCAFDGLISKFLSDKIPRDFRESLPLPLYCFLHWERKILISSTGPPADHHHRFLPPSSLDGTQMGGHAASQSHQSDFLILKPSRLLVGEPKPPREDRLLAAFLLDSCPMDPTIGSWFISALWMACMGAMRMPIWISLSLINLRDLEPTSTGSTFGADALHGCFVLSTSGH